jgi:hypothetical protein
MLLGAITRLPIRSALMRHLGPEIPTPFSWFLVVRADDAPGVAIGRVLLAGMDPVAAQLGRQVGAVVHQEGDAAFLGDGAQGLGRAASPPDGVPGRMARRSHAIRYRQGRTGKVR